MKALLATLTGAPAGAAPRAKLGYSDVVLAFAAVTIISVMILPLPLVLIDMLVAVNISIGFGLLLLGIYIPTPVAFSSFPSVLLLTTLFRLAISIAITRSIRSRSRSEITSAITPIVVSCAVLVESCSSTSSTARAESGTKLEKM